MPKYKLNHNIDEQTCLPHYLVHTRRFSSHSIESGLTVSFCVYCIMYKTQRLEARHRAKLGESKIATKRADKILSNASILLKCDGRTYLRLFHGSNL